MRLERVNRLPNYMLVRGWWWWWSKYNSKWSFLGCATIALRQQPPYCDRLGHRRPTFKNRIQITCDMRYCKFLQPCWKIRKFPGLWRCVDWFRMSLLPQYSGFEWLKSFSMDHWGPEDEGSRILKRQEDSVAYYETVNDFRTKKYSVTRLFWPNLVPVKAAQLTLVARLRKLLDTMTTEPCAITGIDTLWFF